MRNTLFQRRTAAAPAATATASSLTSPAATASPGLLLLLLPAPAVAECPLRAIAVSGTEEAEEGSVPNQPSTAGAVKDSQ
jgi:hypothetical protein